MEERLAAQHGNYTWAEYQALPGAGWWVNPTNPTDSKASVIATYRMSNWIKAVSNDFPPPKKKR